MEARKIIVISSANQSQTVLMSTAETLGELKRELDAKHVDYRGMTFLEGHTKTEMNLDEAILPTNIPYRGTTTNELVFLLTTPQKKIRSGAARYFDSAELVLKVSNVCKALGEVFDVLVNAGFVPESECCKKAGNPLSHDDIVSLFGDMVNLNPNDDDDEGDNDEENDFDE